MDSGHDQKKMIYMSAAWAEYEGTFWEIDG
jgi:hypothetical protein